MMSNNIYNVVEQCELFLKTYGLDNLTSRVNGANEYVKRGYRQGFIVCAYSFKIPLALVNTRKDKASYSMSNT